MLREYTSMKNGIVFFEPIEPFLQFDSYLGSEGAAYFLTYIFPFPRHDSFCLSSRIVRENLSKYLMCNVPPYWIDRSIPFFISFGSNRTISLPTHVLIGFLSYELPFPISDVLILPYVTSGSFSLFLNRKRGARISISSSSDAVPRRGSRGLDDGQATSIPPSTSSTSSSGVSGLQQQMEATAQQIKGLIRRASQVDRDDVTSTTSGRGSISDGSAVGVGSKEGGSGAPTGQSEEDTMKNLRKTFAGIFGDM